MPRGPKARYLATSVAATLLSAAAYGLAFPPHALSSLAWVALVPLFVVLQRVGARAALLLAWLWTIAAAYAVGDWFPRAVAGYFDQPLVVGIGLFAGVSTFMASVEYCAFALVYRRLARPMPARALPLVVAATWVSAELGRVTLFGGNPWALAGYSQVRVLPLVQVADLTGVYGMSFAIVAVNAALAELWLAPGRGGFRRALGGVGLSAVVVALLLGYGTARLRWLDAPTDASDGTEVAIIQADLDLGSQWRPEFYGRNLGAYLRLTRDAIRDYRPALVFWPESAMSFFLADEPQYRAAIAQVTAPADTQLVVGGPSAERRGDATVYHNTAFVLAPDGTIEAAYDKEALLPFAEYFPLGGVDLLRRQFARVREFARGTRTEPLPTRAGTAGVVICNEAMFGSTAARRVRAGAEYLVNLANDTWLGDRKFSAMTFDMATLRAVEERRFLVRASTSGPSAIVDPSGRTTALGPLSHAVIAGVVRPRRGLTIYARAGDAFAYGCLLAVVGAVIRSRARLARIPRRNRRGEDEGSEGHTRRAAWK